MYFPIYKHFKVPLPLLIYIYISMHIYVWIYIHVYFSGVLSYFRGCFLAVFPQFRFFFSFCLCSIFSYKQLEDSHPQCVLSVFTHTSNSSHFIFFHCLPSKPCVLNIKKKKTKTCLDSNLCLPYSPGCVAIHWSMVTWQAHNLMETDFSSCSSQQLPITLQQRVELCDHILGSL